jgi:CRISPR-associated endonuclease/helicase Cas3
LSGRLAAFFEAAPPHASELLETETFRVVEWLASRAQALGEVSHVRISSASDDGENGEDAAEGQILRKNDLAAVALTAAGDMGKVLTLDALAHIKEDYDDEGRKARQSKKPFKHFLHGATLVVDVRLAGLRDGLLNDGEQRPPRAVDDGKSWIVDPTSPSEPPVVRFRVRMVEGGQPLAVDGQWRERLRFVTELSGDGDPSRWLIVEKWRHDSTTEEDRSAGRPQLLDDHQKWAEECARDFAGRLGLLDSYVDMLATVARVHDEGKRARRWQRAFNAPNDGFPYAKTKGPINYALLDGYRHEFASLSYAEKDERLSGLSDDLRDLALHLIAARAARGRRRPSERFPAWRPRRTADASACRRR